MFFRFIKACKKYRFIFSINNSNIKLVLILQPDNSSEMIKIKQKYYFDYFKLFSSAIKEMKMYRKERGYL